VIYADESAHVRAWAAGHLHLNDHAEALLSDADMTVRAAFWSNPECPQLPWREIFVADDWIEALHKMTL
jgi:hypothetical protein